MKNKITKIKWDKNLKLSEWAKKRHEVEGLFDPEIVRFGASDVSVATRSNKYKCPMRLFYHLTGYHSSFFITKKTVAGHLEEPNIVQHFEAWNPNDEQRYLIDVGDKVRHRKLSKAHYFLTNSDYPNIMVSLDYTVGANTYSPITGELYPKDMPVELKTAEGFYYKMWTDGITQPYMEQIQTQMLVANKPMALLLVFVDKEDLRVKEVYADPIMQANILAKVNEFAEKVKVGKMAFAGMKEAEALGDKETYEAFYNIFESVTPEPIGMKDNVELLQEVYDKAIDEDIKTKQGSEQDYHDIGTYLKCIKLTKAIADHKTLATARLLKSCGEYEGIEVGDRKFTNRRATPLKKAFMSCKQTNN